MSHPPISTPAFIRLLSRARELHRVKSEVNPELEITEIASRTVKHQGPALLFERVKGSPHPLLINHFGTPRRIELALGRHPQEIGQELVRFAERLRTPSLRGLLASRHTIKRVLSMKTRMGSTPMRRAAHSPNVTELPMLKCWPKDGGKYITFGLVLTKDPETGIRNLGLYRLQVLTRDRIIFHWQIQKGGGFHYVKAERARKPLEVAVIIGADPILQLAAITPLPEDVDEIAFSGLLRGAPTVMAPGKTTSLEFPAQAEFVLEGFVPPEDRALEGPFGDHFGHYSHPAPFPIMTVTGVWQRPRPTYVAAVVGKPPQEDRYIGDAVQEMLTPLIKLIHPEIVDMWAYYEAGFHNLLVVAVDQRYGKEAMKTALGLLGQSQLSLTKCLVLVDAHVPVRDFHAVLKAIRHHFKPEDDWLLLPGVPLDTLDFTSFKFNLGSKMVLDATKPQPPQSPPPEPTPIDPTNYDPRIQAWTVLEHTLLVLKVPDNQGRSAIQAIIRRPEFAPYKLIVAVSPDVPLDDEELLLWGIFTRFDCARDIIARDTKVWNAWVQAKGPLGIDATFKTGYPDPVVMDERIVKLVDKRWDEYGIRIKT